MNSIADLYGYLQNLLKRRILLFAFHFQMSTRYEVLNLLLD